MGVEWYEAQGIEVRDTDRGGRVTYHGPGQLVAYPIVSLRPYGDDVHEYVRGLERVAIASLADHGVERRDDRGPDRGLGPPPPTGRSRRRPSEIGPSAAQDRLDRGPRQPRGHHPRAGGQRQQRPAAVRVDRALRDRGLPVTSLSRELGAEQDLGAFADDARRPLRRGLRARAVTPDRRARPRPLRSASMSDDRRAHPRHPLPRQARRRPRPTPTARSPSSAPASRRG